MWVYANESYPPVGKNIQVMLIDGKTIHAKTELKGNVIKLTPINENLGEIELKDILYWSEIKDSAPPRKPCQRCGGRRMYG